MHNKVLSLEAEKSEIWQALLQIHNSHTMLNVTETFKQKHLFSVFSTLCLDITVSLLIRNQQDTNKLPSRLYKVALLSIDFLYIIHII